MNQFKEAVDGGESVALKYGSAVTSFGMHDAKRDAHFELGPTKHTFE